MKRLLLIAALFAALNATAAPHGPDLRFHINGEFGTNVAQLNNGVLNTFFIARVPYSPALAQVGLHYPGVTNEVRRVLQFNVALVNVGDNHWSAGNAFAHPQRFRMLPGMPQPYVVGLYGVVLSHTNGTIAREYMGVTSLVWDSYASLPRLEKGPFSWFMPGTSAGHASQGLQSWIADGTYVDITGLTNAVYDFNLVMDPLNEYGQRATHKIHRLRFYLNGFDSRLVTP